MNEGLLETEGLNKQGGSVCGELRDRDTIAVAISFGFLYGRNEESDSLDKIDKKKILAEDLIL